MLQLDDFCHIESDFLPCELQAIDCESCPVYLDYLKYLENDGEDKNEVERKSR